MAAGEDDSGPARGGKIARIISSGRHKGTDGVAGGLLDLEERKELAGKGILYAPFDLRVAMLHDALNADTVTQGQRTEAFAAIDTALGTMFAQNPPENPEMLAAAIGENARYKDVLDKDRLDTFLKDVPALPADNPLEIFRHRQSRETVTASPER